MSGVAATASPSPAFQSWKSQPAVSGRRVYRVEAGIAAVHGQPPQAVAVDVGDGGELGIDASWIAAIADSPGE